MPLLRRKPFALAEPPNDLEPCERLFQIRFTKEIFRDYKYLLSFIYLYKILPVSLNYLEETKRRA